MIGFTDRLEGFLLGSVTLAAVVAIPITAVVGYGLYEEQRHVAAQEARSRYFVNAVALTDSSGPDLARYPTVKVRLQLNEIEHTPIVKSPVSVRKGEALQIWVDDTGGQTSPPPTRAGAIIVSGSVWLSVIVLAGVSIALIRGTFARLRMHGWDRQLRSLSGCNGGSSIDRS